MIERELTGAELRHLNRTRGRCPACKTGDLAEGPNHGARGQQFRCRKCGAVFLLGIAAHGSPVIWFGELMEPDPSSTGFYRGGMTLAELWPSGLAEEQPGLFERLWRMVGGA